MEEQTVSKYKVGDKFVIEIGAERLGDPILYRIKGFNALVFDDNGLDRLERVNGMTLRDAYDEGFEKGLEEGRNEKDCKACMDTKANADYNAGYEDGLIDAWNCAKKISMLDDATIEELFGTSKFNRFNLGYNGVEIKKLLEEYEAKQAEIKVGDIVRYNENDGIITFIKENQMYVMWEDGSAGEFCDAEKWFKKTGRHYDIESILEQLKGADDDI